MALLGSLVKRGLGLHQKFQVEFKSPQEQQESQLRNMLEKAQDTAFGRYYGFRELLNASNVMEAFREEVPIHDYQRMHEGWWKQQQKYPDITWPGKPNFFALSSGTTGKSSKRIPITDDLLQSIRQVGVSLASGLSNFDLPEALFESEVLMLSSTANLSKHDQGHLEGEISGINVNNFPGWYDLFYRPGKEIAAIGDWDTRIARIVEEAPNWNIGAIAGIPSWVLMMLKAVIEGHGLKNIHEIWPNFMLYNSGGVAFETFRKDFEAVCGHPITIIDTYLASEGFFAHTARPGTMDMLLALNHGYYYEFVPFDERGVDEHGGLLDQPVVHTLSEVEPEQDYVLLVTSCAGAWRYTLGDTIKFTSTDPYEIKITGRTKFFLNVVGSQLSEEKMDAAIVQVSEELGVQVNEYVVSAVKNDAGEYIHQWVVVSDDQISETEFTAHLDEALQSMNKNYRVARSKALKGLQVLAIDKDRYHRYLGSNKKLGGQVKTPKVMGAEKMEGFLAVVTK